MIRPGSIYADMGFRNGDTLHTIEGVELTDPKRDDYLREKILSEEQETVSLSLTRDGCPASMEVTLL